MKLKMKTVDCNLNTNGMMYQISLYYNPWTFINSIFPNVGIPF